MPSSNTCWGLDIGASEIKAIKLERGDGGVASIVDFTVVPHRRVLSTPGVDPNEIIRLSLSSLVSQYGDDLRKSQVALSVAGHQAFARFAKLPPVEAKGVPNLVKFEAVQQIPFPIEEVEWDYQIFASDDSPDVEVGIFAITKERIHEMLTLYGESGVQPTHITLSPVAAFNAMAYDLEFTEETEGTVILDVGAHATDLIVADQGRVWIRTFPLGGHQMTEALAEAFKLEYPKAEKLKRTAETSKYKKQVFQALQPVLSDFIQDVQRSLSYHQDAHPESKLTRLIGLGSTFKLLGLRKLLENQLNLKVHRLERFKRLSLDGATEADFEAVALNMATAYGLALQGLGLTPISANLMPTTVIRDRAWKRKTPVFVTAACLLLAAGGVTFVRPLLAADKKPNLSADTQINRVVAEARTLKGEWDSQSRENQPSFLVTNALMLADEKALYSMILDDIAQINAAAGEEGGAAAFDVQQLDLTYLPPGTPIEFDGIGDLGGDSGGPGGGRGGGRSTDPYGGQDAGPVAGELGAVRVAAVFETSRGGGLPFFNNNVLEWLRSNTDRAARPYTIMTENLRAEQVQLAGAGQESGRARGGGGGGGPGERRPDREPIRTPQIGAAPATLDGLAPLPPIPGKVGPAAQQTFGFTWVLQLRRPPALVDGGNTEGGE